MNPSMRIPEKSGEERKKEYVDGIKKTIIPGIFGIIGGFISFYLAGNGIGGVQPRAGFGLIILVFVIFIQKYVFPLVSVRAEELGAKDWLYIGFMTLAFWFVSWTFLLTCKYLK
ncbi:MAG: hypothetical protein QMC78_00710 [Methanocellales archaeon]|nr:hypothetical protein [Methanocellales archaeon]